MANTEPQTTHLRALLCLKAEGEKETTERNAIPPSGVAAPASGPEPIVSESPTAHTNGLNDGAPCQAITEPAVLDLHIPETSKSVCDVLIHFSVYSVPNSPLSNLKLDVSHALKVNYQEISLN